MRSKPRSNMSKVAIVLAILAAIWLVFGTAFFLGLRYWVRNNTIASASRNEEIQEDESDVEDFDDEGTDLDDDMKDDQDFYDDDEINEKYGDDPDDPDGDDLTDDDDDDDDVDDGGDDDDDDVDDDEDDSDADDGIRTFRVDAWDGFAAVRTGRGTGYDQVGRLNNGEKVKVTDLEDGWYKIAAGKWKGYYLHESSLK